MASLAISPPHVPFAPGSSYLLDALVPMLRSVFSPVFCFLFFGFLFSPGFPFFFRLFLGLFVPLFGSFSFFTTLHLRQVLYAPPLLGILDLVHSDVCDPMKTRTLGGCLYFVTFIDDHSRKLWVYTLKRKDQVLDVFKQFQASVERQTGKKLRCIRTNNKGEYLGPFDEYCKQQGIWHQMTPLKTPQLNGLTERMNKTLVERVRCLLSQS
jgi:hypothetical protein